MVRTGAPLVHCSCRARVCTIHAPEVPRAFQANWCRGAREPDTRGDPCGHVGAARCSAAVLPQFCRSPRLAEHSEFRRCRLERGIRDRGRMGFGDFAPEAFARAVCGFARALALRNRLCGHDPDCHGIVVLPPGAGWHLSEINGASDLRFYAALEAYAVLLLLAILLLLPRYTRSSDLAIVVGFYVLAKITEAADRPIFALGHVVSGHTIKHLAAAAAGLWILRMLQKRRPVERVAFA